MLDKISKLDSGVLRGLGIAFVGVLVWLYVGSIKSATFAELDPA